MPGFVLYNIQNKHQIICLTTFINWCLLPRSSVFTARYALNLNYSSSEPQFLEGHWEMCGRMFACLGVTCVPFKDILLNITILIAVDA